MLYSRSSGSEADPPPKASLLNGREILVIESNPEIRSLLSDRLQSAGARIETASSLAAAQEIMSRKCLALILSSIHFADGKICHVVRNLRQREMLEDHLGKQPRHIPVIVLLSEEVAFDPIAHRQECRTLLDVGVDVVMTRPLIFENLIRLIEQTLRSP